MKRVIFIIAILISLIILFFITADIINSMVSYKYEIEEAFGCGFIDKELASGYLEGKIRWLKFFTFYVVGSIILFIGSISKSFLSAFFVIPAHYCYKLLSGIVLRFKKAYRKERE